MIFHILMFDAGSFHAFVAAVQVARLSTRIHTHTLDLTKVKPSLIGTANLSCDWLRNLFDNLPNLQSLICDSLPDFDHRSLLVLRGIDPRGGQLRYLNQRSYGLKVLTAFAATNVVASSLECALQCFPQLKYLDLSSTRAANTTSVLRLIASSHNFPALEILKLRNIGLTDHGLDILSDGLGTRVWSLDLRNNRLTESSMHSFLHSCTLPPHHITPNRFHEDQMDYVNGLGPADDEASVVRHFAIPQTISTLRHHSTGVTHLYVSDNPLSIASFCALIGRWRLIALDWGKLRYDSDERAETPIEAEEMARRLTVAVLEAELKAGARLHYLRIEHGLVTGPCATAPGVILQNEYIDSMPVLPSQTVNSLQSRAPPDERDGTPTCYKDLPGLGLHTLVLTGLPARSEHGPLIHNLLTFLRNCGVEESAILAQSGDLTSGLRELRLEIAQGPEVDALESDLDALCFLNALDDDFSFFSDNHSSDDELRTRKQTPSNDATTLYKGDLVQQLKRAKTNQAWKWTGKLAILPSPRNTERLDPVPDLSRAIII